MPLGQGDHSAYLYDRGGVNRIAEITGATLVRWSRMRDDISMATVIVTSPGPDCCAALRDAAVGRHELVIFRNGVRVWEGPLTRMTFKATTVEVTAHDICHYLSRTIMRGVYDNRYSAKANKVGPVTTRMNTILRNELKRKEGLSPPINVLPFLWINTNASTAKTSRLNAAYESSVWEEMDSLAQRSGMDYTTIGRRLMIFDTDDVIGRLPVMTDGDFTDELVISSYGMELCTYSAVTNGEGIWAAVGVGPKSSPSIHPFYGEQELVSTNYSDSAIAPKDPEKPTAAELAAMVRAMQSQAARNLSGRVPTPLVVRLPSNTGLNPNLPIDINDLIPGIRVPIRATMTCIEVQQEQKLDAVTVEQTGEGETISVILGPAPGSSPWAGDDNEGSGPGDE